jgi:thiamine pyrophosphate-dependent acetolactate synthase large subunit-like protein
MRIKQTLINVVVSSQQGFGKKLGGVARALGIEVAFDGHSHEMASANSMPIFNRVLGSATRFLEESASPVSMRIVQAESFAQAESLIDKQCRQGETLALVWYDLTDDETPRRRMSEFDRRIESLAEATQAVGGGIRLSSYSTIAYISHQQYNAHPWQSVVGHVVRVWSNEEDVACADMLVNLTNYLNHTEFNKLALRRLSQKETPVPLGRHLIEFLDHRSESGWLLNYFTGSVVSSLIKSAESLARQSGAFIIRSTNEHGLACGAFINWRLYKRPFLTIITSGMLDELKGTLANLQQVGARGFIVCAEAREGKWFGFQSTLNTDADVRKVLKARNIPFVYLQDPQDVGPGLEQAFKYFDTTESPIVILATQQVLESQKEEAPPRFTSRPLSSAHVTSSAIEERALQEVVDIVNKRKLRILWHCGAVDPGEELELLLKISDEAGIAISEALSAPGFVPEFHNGCEVPNHLGMMGQYGTDQRVYDYLLVNGKPRPLEEQCVFMLKNKAGQIDSPFSDGAHQRRMNIVSVNKNPDHLAPFAQTRVQMKLLDFLKYVDKRLNVDPGIASWRRGIIESCRPFRRDAASYVPSLPMSPNYFFMGLREMLVPMITDEGYRFTGMYDVGHCGTLAVRYLPRTDPCFSGWYGRGLMGDSLQATVPIAFTGNKNIIAVTGDGARQLVPDILPSFLENIENGNSLNDNVTIFYCVNNSLSVINSYQERMMMKDGGRQMKVSNDLTIGNEIDENYHGVHIVKKVLRDIDFRTLAKEMKQPSRLNLYFVSLCATNDGISIVDSQNWQYR